MPKILTIDEMLTVIKIDERPEFASLKDEAEALGTKMAALIAAKYDIDFSNATYDACGGTCSCFSPKTESQNCPTSINEFDPGGEWEIGE
jgi:hypothetical protein